VLLVGTNSRGWEGAMRYLNLPAAVLLLFAPTQRAATVSWRICRRNGERCGEGSWLSGGWGIAGIAA
jgi:hypothetical protein